MSLYDQLHPDWQRALKEFKPLMDEIDSHLLGQNIAPTYKNVMRALNTPIDCVRVIIVGQDPYPTAGYAHGLAFSVDSSVSQLPASLRNIFKELEDDLGIAPAQNGDLSRWCDQGVLLLNRVLTTNVGQSLSHGGLGWQRITDEVARVLGEKEVVALLWGKTAQELAHYFSPELTLTSSHPSPLSAYRGFFGSQPFSTANKILKGRGNPEISW